MFFFSPNGLHVRAGLRARLHFVLLRIIFLSPFLFFYLCAPCFSRCAIKRVTVFVVTVNVFPRADEIEMLMTDLERANQVTCPNPLWLSCFFLFFFFFFPTTTTEACQLLLLLYTERETLNRQMFFTFFSYGSTLKMRCRINKTFNACCGWTQIIQR